MPIPSFLSALQRELPVLFVNIGWALRYDGTERIVGHARYLKNHPRDNSEAQAFRRRPGGVYECGIGIGKLSGPTHIVFSAFDLGGKRRVVGLYAAAVSDIKDGWCWARARVGICIPVDRRPIVTGWPSGQGLRRWAERAASDTGRSHSQLARCFKSVRRRLPELLEKPPQDVVADQTYADIAAREGQEREYLLRHKKREGWLRQAKIEAALAANGHRLICEVPGCGFDFGARYGDLGYGYAHVHHLTPLADTGKRGRNVGLDDLAVVCANCHAMIHRGGECRDLKSIIPRQRSARAKR